MIDTHTHLYMRDDYPDGGSAAVERAIAAGVSHMVFPGVDVKSVRPMLDLHALFPENTSVAIGLHPTEVTPDWRDDLREIRYRFGDVPYVAWGEIGVDLHWENTPEIRTRQMDVFGHQLDEAFSEGLPVIIHSRDAIDETLEVIGMMGERTPGLLFHSFTSNPDDARRILEAHPDAMFGFNGVATFKNAPDVRAAAKFVGPEHILLETDAPWLAPVPHRGSTNESSFIPHILARLAEELDIPADQLERVTDASARRFFNLTA